MKKIAIIALALACTATPALAENGVERWDGIYAGVNAGGSWITGDMTGYTPYNGYDGFPVTDANDGSFAGGVQIGYNKQIGSLGLGAEASLNFTGLKKQTTSSTPGTLFWRNSDFNATVGPRVTIATPSFAIYGKGGLAVGKFEVGHNQNGTLISSKETAYGYMLGAGVDVALGPKLSLGVQYEYQDYGRGNIHVPSANSDIFIAPNATIHNVKAVANYRF
ncbi:MAG: outer membrane protein [Novosphingobium sp.]